MIDQRKKEICLGQGCNLAMQYILSSKKELSPEDFDIIFKHQAKRFFNLLMDLQEELENAGGMKK